MENHQINTTEENTVVKQTFKASDLIYQRVSLDLRQMAVTLKDSEKSTLANAMAKTIGNMSEKNPGTSVQQAKIAEFIRQSERLKAKTRNNELGHALEN